LKINDNTPEKFLNMAGMIRENNSSLVLISEKAIKRAMMGMGFTEEEARTCDISGCYEYKVRAKEVVTAPLYLNLLKAVELVFYNGVDPMTQKKIGCETGEIKTITSFDEFYQAFIKQLEHIMDVSFECVDDLECYFHDLNPANMFSATIENSLKTAQDAFSCGSVYNNTSVLHTGLASTADALLAIKQFVFEKKELSLAEMKTALANNWSGYEKLRLKILNSKCKFGNGVSEADNLVEAIARLSSNKINKRPNKRNGFYKAAMHSARTFITMGEKTGATPDGRKAGDEMSKNISPVMGMDRNGITALINSVNKIDSAMFPEDYCLDAMLHPVTVQGNEGLEVMKKLVSTYMERGGGSIHFNIFDVNTLRAAQKNPELYEGLQIRVCGWNVRFNDICKEEQDMYIKRAANIQD
jgi:formate C-acetyltransferase